MLRALLFVDEEICHTESQYVYGYVEMRNLVRVSDESLPPVPCLLNQFEIKKKIKTLQYARLLSWNYKLS